ncbi:MAG: alkaline phosphatase family protein [Proteobacteria bacterium]|nr:alkaline phosphatase family protein [Pseudomonadota bacterium]
MRGLVVKIRCFSLLIFLALLLCGGASASGLGSGGRNAPDQLHKPYLVLISIDGFRWDYPDLYPTPAIDRIAERGLKAEAMQPAFPTLTFPNFYSIATGMLPAHHGLVANEFPGEETGSWYNYKTRSTVQDGSWYLAEPIWVTAEKQGMVTAAYFFVGTEADVRGVRPTHWRKFNTEDSGEQRVRQVLKWLAEPAEVRPHLITLYFEEVDDYAHWYGPGSPQSIESISRVDEQIGQLLDGIEKLPFAEDVYIVLVSDHGQALYQKQKPVFILDQHVVLDGARLVEGGPYVFIHFDQEDETRVAEIRDTINRAWNCGRALLPEDAPESWAVNDSRRFPDIIVQADPGCAVISSSARRNKITPGDHGWPPEMKEMRGIFMASGPGIAPGTRTGVIHVTDVYPLMMKILGLPFPGPIDGDPDRLPALLETQPD